MSYVSLKKYFYKDPNKGEEEYLKRFNSDEAIRLDIELNGKPAFFVMSNDIYRSVLRLMKADKNIATLTKDLPVKALHQFTIENLISEIVITNEIEGVNSTRKEIGNALEYLEQDDKRIRFKGLVKKYLMLNDSHDKPITSAKEIREIYDELVLEEVLENNPEAKPDGKLFRKDSVSVYDSAGREVHTGTQGEARIVDALEKLLLFLNRIDVNPLVRVAVFHFAFGYIHPFYDGNGRINRYVSSRYVSIYYEPLIGYGLSFIIKQRLKEYYQAFKEVEHPLNRGDLTPFVISFCDMVAESAEMISASLNEKKNQFDHCDRAIQIKLNSKGVTDQHLCDLSSVLLQATLFAESGISTKELVSFFGVSRQTINNWVKKVSEVLKIEKTKEGKDVFYQVDLTGLEGVS